ncbi:amino acid adenylation domain-containing protein [Paraburkholderia sp. BL6669N2]|uniref:amino acid adenylation domain-containing protein n=1 Tax=Paraburkholderia sp. BL6669N2 TaxID=1938807 RepID=UPI000E2374E2|nr:amino acid adenylation domain-containing protein [Paraburkholderia sp. BL6669N2]
MTVTLSWPQQIQSPVTLPFEGRRSTVRSDKFATAELALPLMAETAAERAVLLLTATVVILARYNNADHISVGVAKAGSALGLFLSTPQHLSVRALADDLRAALEGLHIGPSDLDKQVASAERDAAVGRDPLFAIMMALDDAPAPFVQQDLTLHFDDTSGRLVANYSARLFRPEIVSGFLRHLRCVRQAIEADASATVGCVQYIDAAEQSDLRGLGSGGAPAHYGTVAQHLSAALTCGTDEPVLEFHDQSWTLGDLMRHADQIISGLGPLVQKGARFGIGLRPGPDQIAAILAAVRVGAVIVPLDTTLPARRLAAILADAALSVIITEMALVAHFADFAVDALLIETLPASDARLSSWSVITIEPDSALYLLFTSGSTGRPKGVLVPHRTLANLVAWEDQQRPTRGKRTLGRTSIAFDVGLQEIFATILFGGILVLASDNERSNVGALANLLARLRISRVYLPPVALHQMAESAPDNVTALDCLEHVIVAGEVLRISQAIRRFFRSTRARLINQYGPTETHVATEVVLDDAPLRWPDLPVIGRPIAGVDVHILDAAGVPVPLLVPGEVAIGGIVPAIGYVSKPELTEVRFVDDARAGRVYRSGDRAKWRLDGALEFVGRTDDQVKVRGYRIELLDLEVNAASLAGVRQAAAKFWTSGDWKGLALYFVLDPVQAPTMRELREALRERVPEYMLPPLHAMFALKELPLTASGKIDRGQLPEPSVSEVVEAEPLDVGGRIRAIWSRRLGLAQFEPDEDFIDLGGDSLLAIQVVSEINDAFKIAVPLSTLLRGTSLRRLTGVVEGFITSRTTRINLTTVAPGQLETSTMGEPRHDRRVASVDLPCGRFVTPSPSETRHLWQEIYGQRAYHPDTIRYAHGDTIVDVGANVGVFSRFALDITGGCRLIAIEPADELFQCLRSNLAARSSGVTLLKLGCRREDSEATTFFYFPRVPAMSSFRPDSARDRSLLEELLKNDPVWSEADDRHQKEQFLKTAFAAESQPCPTRRLSTIFAESGLDHIDILKVDVQRGEEDVLAGLSETDWPKIRQCVVELQDHKGSVAAMRSFLQAREFSVDVSTIPLHEGTDVRFVYAWRRV